MGNLKGRHIIEVWTRFTVCRCIQWHIHAYVCMYACMHITENMTEIHLAHECPFLLAPQIWIWAPQASPKVQHVKSKSMFWTEHGPNRTCILERFFHMQHHAPCLFDHFTQCIHACVHACLLSLSMQLCACHPLANHIAAAKACGVQQGNFDLHTTLSETPVGNTDGVYTAC